MTIKITFEYATVDEAVAALALLSGKNVTKAAAPKPVKEASSPPPAAAPTAPAPTPAPPASSPAPAAAAPTGPDYPTLQQAVFKLAAKNRDATIAVFASLGVPNAKALPQERWAEALDVVNAKLAELDVA